MKNNVLITVAVAVVCAAGGFFGGMQYGKSAEGFGPGGMTPPNGMPQGASGSKGMASGSRPVSGEITSMDGSTLTLKTKDGGSVIVVYSQSTTISKSTSGSTADLKTGEAVSAVGTQGTDGTVTAESIAVGARADMGPSDMRGK